MQTGVNSNLWRRTQSGLLGVNRRNFPIDGLELYLPLWHPELSSSPIISKDPNAHSATVTGAIHLPNVGRDFDEVDDRITFGTVNSHKWMHGFGNTSAFKWTIAAWIKLHNPGGNNACIFDTGGIGSLSDTGVGVFIRTTLVIEMGIFTGGGSGTELIVSAPATTYPNNSLYHFIAVTYDQSLGSANAKTYLDDVAIETADKTATTPSVEPSSMAPQLGRFSSGGNPTSDFDGIIGDHWIWEQRVLSASELLHIYNVTKWRYQ